jgi:membrane protein
MTFLSLFADIRKRFLEAQVLLTASSLAYTTILSIIPLLAVSFALFKTLGGLDQLYDTLEPLIVSNLAAGTSADVIAQIQSFINNTHANTVGLTGFIGLLITSVSMLYSIEDAFNRIWKVQRDRSLTRKAVIYAFFIILGPLALAIALGLVTSKYLPLSTLLPDGVSGFLLAIGAFTLIYKLVPNLPVLWEYAATAGTFTAICWVIARWGYEIYATRFISYHRIYGGLAAVPILLLWIYIIWVIVLTGAALSAALQQTAPGPDRRLSLRFVRKHLRFHR